ncbi:MAG: 2Fe-2S iron-sulfur cluster binding domain-containing protein [Oscillospiraceae bacterium]|nr:2Fe-2S iron-sulfur cluster binding domain-containing protein [Oscillospiraceae bacterium]
MVKLTIDGRPVAVEQGTTILDAAKKAGIDIPTLCYLKELNEIGACRVCVVEIEGQERLSAACATVAEEGMVVHTSTPRVLDARRINVQLILSQHNVSCTTCMRNGNCKLQKVALDLNLQEEPFEKKPFSSKWDKTFPLIRDGSRCIQCLRCVNVCEKVQSLGVWSLTGTGKHARVEVTGGKSIRDVNCALCGQCITHCPVGALTVRDDTQKVREAIADPSKLVVVQVAPAVRAAWGDAVDLPAEAATEKRMVAAIRSLGVDYVFDTDFSADLTIMEEGSELIEHIKEGKEGPMFTSCCPGWVRFLKLEYPHLVRKLSTAKSPQQMFGAVAKSYYAQLLGVEPERIFCVSVMPCSAKKYECDVSTVNDAAAKDVDVVLTTRELGRLLRHVDVAALPEEEFDQPLGTATGAGVIFGATGGVMEAALRSAYYLLTGRNPEADAFSEVRGLEGWKEASFQIRDKKLKVAVVSGLGNARRLIEALERGEVSYDFVEVMACPGGCAGGGGQPIRDGQELAGERGERLYTLDRSYALRFSHENPAVGELYKSYLGAPLSHRAHELLHTEQENWEL